MESAGLRNQFRKRRRVEGICLAKYSGGNGPSIIPIVKNVSIDIAMKSHMKTIGSIVW
jgi:hypothetical protein